MLSVRYRQLTEKGLSPFKICSLVGCSSSPVRNAQSRCIHAEICSACALTTGWPDLFGSPNNLENPPIVNGPAHKNLLSRAFEQHRLRGSRETRRCSFRGVYILQTHRLLLFRRCGGASPRFFTAR